MADKMSTHQAQEDARSELMEIYLNGRIAPKHQALIERETQP